MDAPIPTLPIPEIMSLVRYSFRKTDFTAIESALRAREELVKADVRRHFADEISRRDSAERTRSEEWRGKLRELEVRLSLAEEERDGGRRREEECRNAIKELSEEVRRKKMEEAKFGELKVAYMDLEDAKIAAEAEAVEWKRRYGKLEAWTLRMLEENPSLMGRWRSGPIEPKEERLGSKRKGEDSVVVVPGRDEIIEISDMEDEHDGGKVNASKDMKAELSLESLNLEQLAGGAAGEGEASCSENFGLVPPSKRKRSPRIAASESEDEDDRDQVPTGKPKMKSFAEVLDGVGGSQRSPENCSATNASSHNVISYPATHLKQWLASLWPSCKRKRARRRPSARNSVARSLLEADGNNVLSERTCRRPINPVLSDEVVVCVLEDTEDAMSGNAGKIFD